MSQRPKLETLKMPKENIGGTLHNVGVGKDFLNRTSFAQQERQMTDKWDFMKIKIFCTAK